MRFKNKEPKQYEEREVTKFLIFPKRLKLKNGLNIEETRWLEKAKIQQFYSRGLGWIDFRRLD